MAKRAAAAAENDEPKRRYVVERFVETRVAGDEDHQVQFHVIDTESRGHIRGAERYRRNPLSWNELRAKAQARADFYEEKNCDPATDPRMREFDARSWHKKNPDATPADNDE